VSDWFEADASGNPVDVAAVMDSSVPELLWAIVEAGALVSVGTTSDGGALAITVTLDGRWRRQYFRESELAVEWLTGAREAVESGGARPAASPGPRKRSRRS
jgi:hypothetical protein